MDQISLAIFVEVHLIISVKSISILTTGFRGVDVSSFLHKYIRETGHAPGSHVFCQIKFVLAIFVEGHPVTSSIKSF